WTRQGASRPELIGFERLAELHLVGVVVDPLDPHRQPRLGKRGGEEVVQFTGGQESHVGEARGSRLTGLQAPWDPKRRFTFQRGSVRWPLGSGRVDAGRDHPTGRGSRRGRARPSATVGGELEPTRRLLLLRSAAV